MAIIRVTRTIKAKAERQEIRTRYKRDAFHSPRRQRRAITHHRSKHLITPSTQHSTTHIHSPWIACFAATMCTHVTYGYTCGHARSITYPCHAPGTRVCNPTGDARELNYPCAGQVALPVQVVQQAQEALIRELPRRSDSTTLPGPCYGWAEQTRAGGGEGDLGGWLPGTGL